MSVRKRLHFQISVRPILNLQINLNIIRLGSSSAPCSRTIKSPKSDGPIGITISGPPHNTSSFLSKKDIVHFGIAMVGTLDQFALGAASALHICARASVRLPVPAPRRDDQPCCPDRVPECFQPRLDVVELVWSQAADHPAGRPTSSEIAEYNPAL